ncbi:hypothetical protein [Flavobacterium hiemivividum]|uniref:Lipoprotein n=1 Tax=Flavobacterium hiemivividum TaxID=2541734 RepID=A0A4R5D596_9FLAO|nr:hypothetical protein [Flavobacterium hiemivividum]TDE06761.1 hypothetical protein E0F98_03860 [Flavobacterium hiemivividum]
MSYIYRVLVLILSAFSLSFCALKQNNEMDFPQEIAAAYFQKIDNNQADAKVAFDFFIVLDKPIEQGTFLDKIYFKNQTAIVEKENDRTFVAHFRKDTTNQDLILDSDSTKEYGNKAPVVVKPKFELEPAEAVLEYRNKEKTFFYKINGVKERPMIPNPSGIKPKN